MPNEPDDMKSLWQNQEVETMKITLDELRARAAAFHRKIRMRNVGEYAASVIAIVMFGAGFVHNRQPIPRLSFAMIIAATLYIAYNLYTRGSSQPAPPEMGRASCLEFHRQQLERQRQLVASIWSWYLGPFIPGMALFIGFSIVTAPPQRRLPIGVYAVLGAALFWWIGRMNARAARKLARQIEEIKEMEQV